jgi:hypothetical protein
MGSLIRRTGMTPTHLQLIDQILQQALRSVQTRSAEIDITPTPLAVEQLRKSQLGRMLTVIGSYAEGYTITGDVRHAVQIVGRALFATPLSPEAFTFPEGFHRTPLGTLINEALARLYTQELPGQLLTMADMRARFGVKRQTVHQWIAEGLIAPVYINQTARFPLQEVERLQARREQRKQQPPTQ